MKQEQIDRHRKQTCGYQEGEWKGERRIGNLRLADACYYIEDG